MGLSGPNIRCSCIVCGKTGESQLVAPTDISNVYEIAWKKFQMKGWHRLPNNNTKGHEWIYYCPECGGR